MQCNLKEDLVEPVAIKWVKWGTKRHNTWSLFSFFSISLSQPQSATGWSIWLDASSHLRWSHPGPVNWKLHFTGYVGRNWVRSSWRRVAVQTTCCFFFLFVPLWNNCYFWLFPLGNYCQNIWGQGCNLGSGATKVCFRIGDRWKPNSLQQQTKQEKHLEPFGSVWPYLTQGNPVSHPTSLWASTAGPVWCCSC